MAHCHFWWEKDAIGNSTSKETTLGETPLVTIKETSLAELPEIAQLRYQVYVSEMNRMQKYADHDNKMIVDPLDDTAVILGAEANGQFVGTARVNFCSDGNLGDYADFYEIDQSPECWLRSSITTRLMVRPKFRGTRLPLQLAQASFDIGLKNNIRWNYIDCNPPLVSFFKRLGYVERFKKEHVEYGDVSCMRLDLYDQDHLAAVGSPLLSNVQAYVAEYQS